MRFFLVALTLFLAPSALAQAPEAPAVSGTWSAVTARAVTSMGDTLLARSAQTLVLRADDGEVSGLSHVVTALPTGGTWGVLEACAEQAFARSLAGAVEADGTVRFETLAEGPRGGLDRAYTARLSADGAELVVTPAFESAMGPVTYRRVALAAR